MSESKHTSGPWEVSEKHPHTVIAGEFTYRPHWPGIGNVGEMEANARLIASAPDLIEALKELVEHFDDEVLGHKRRDQAEIVIAQAEGRL